MDVIGEIERIGGIVIIDTINTINTINTIGTIISISLRGRQSRSGVLASKGVRKSSLSEAEGLSNFPKQRDAAVSIL